MKKNILIVGGGCGVGLKLARHYLQDGHTVCVADQHDPELTDAQFCPLAVAASTGDLIAGIDRVVSSFGNAHTLVYVAGLSQRGSTAWTDEALLTTTNIGVIAPMLLAARLKSRAPTPLKLMLITSSSAHTPCPHDPGRSAAGAGLAMLGASLVRDPGFGKVLVAAVSDNGTGSWEGSNEDTSIVLDSTWTAGQIVQLSSGPFKFKSAKILNAPPRVEVVEKLDNQFQPIE